MKRVVPALTLGSYTVFLVWVATRPGPVLPWLEPYWDKAQHTAAFVVLTLAALWVLGYPALSSRKCAVRGLWAAVYAFAVGGSIEYLQSGIPGRRAETADLVADMVGAAGAVLFALTILRRRERLKRA